MAEKRETEALSPLVDTGTCGLNTVHNSSKAGIKSSRWIVGKLMKAMWKLRNESPVLKEKYVALAETNLFPLPFCGHRWCESDVCAERAELLWDGYTFFFIWTIHFWPSPQKLFKLF